MKKYKYPNLLNNMDEHKVWIPFFHQDTDLLMYRTKWDANGPGFLQVDKAPGRALMSKPADSYFPRLR